MKFSLIASLSLGLVIGIAMALTPISYATTTSTTTSGSGVVNFFTVSGTNTCTSTVWPSYGSDGNIGFPSNLPGGSNPQVIPTVQTGTVKICIELILTSQAHSTTYTIQVSGSTITSGTNTCTTDSHGNADCKMIFTLTVTAGCLTNPITISPSVTGAAGANGDQIHHIANLNYNNGVCTTTVTTTTTSTVTKSTDTASASTTITKTLSSTVTITTTIPTTTTATSTAQSTTTLTSTTTLPVTTVTSGACTSTGSQPVAPSKLSGVSPNWYSTSSSSSSGSVSTSTVTSTVTTTTTLTTITLTTTYTDTSVTTLTSTVPVTSTSTSTVTTTNTVPVTTTVTVPNTVTTCTTPTSGVPEFTGLGGLLLVVGLLAPLMIVMRKGLPGFARLK